MNPLDPRLYREVRRPVEDASTLPPFAYHDPAFYELERARVFLRGWQFVGHEDRVPSPGDYAAFDFAGVPVVLVRGEDGRLRAFANTCRHRGALLLEGEGSCRAIVCPYHGWTYGLDGRLRGARGMEDTRDFRLDEHGLRPLRLRQLGRLVWISFEPEGADLPAHLGDMVSKLAPYALERLRLVRRTEYDVACNWKVYVENFMDYYHTPTVHRQSLATSSLSVYHQSRPVAELGDGGHYMNLYARHEGSAALLAGAEGFGQRSGLTGRTREGSTYFCAFPCGLIAGTTDCVWYVEIHPTGPRTMRLAVGACFDEETVARPDFESRLEPYCHRWDVTVVEDNEINERQQRGVVSPLATAGRVSVLETLSHLFRNWLLDRLEIPRESPAGRVA